jgi:mannose/fructose-specific phosphotransferase system component IIA
MKMFLVSNGKLAEAVKASLAEYFTTPNVIAVGFDYENHYAAQRQLAAGVAEALLQDPQEELLIVSDQFASTAWNEAALLLARCHLRGQALLLTGMNVSMVLKLYGMKDDMNLLQLRSLYEGTDNLPEVDTPVA